MIQQFLNNSSWRKHDINIAPKEVYTLNFRDTLPNIFVVNNPNEATLKIGISSLPRSDSYEFKIEHNTTETLGRPIGTNNLYIYNDSGIPVKIMVFSIEKDFDPAILKNMNVSMDGYTFEATSEIVSIKEGVKIPVTFDNSIDLEMKVLLSDIKSMLLTRLEITALKSQIDNLTNMVRDRIEEVSTRNSNPEYMNNVNNFSYQAFNPETVHFAWLFNDGEELTVKRNNETIFTVKEGEAFSDLEFELDTDDVLTITGNNASMRIKYWYYLR